MARPLPASTPPGGSLTAAAGGSVPAAGTAILGFFSLTIKMHTMG